MAILITEKGVRLTVPERPGKPFRRDELALLLGGPPEVISLVTTRERSMCLVVNAEARVPIIVEGPHSVFKMNPMATEILHMFYNTIQFVVGNALLCKVPEEME